MAMVCSQCGAPLEVVPGASLAQCKYCGVKVQLAPRGAQPVERRPVHAAPQKAVWLVPAALAGALTLIGAITAVSFLTQSPAGPPVLPVLRVPQLPGVLAAATKREGPDNFRQPVCTLDANGDGVGDLLGLASEGGTPDRPTLVNGVDGKVLWTPATSSKDSPQVACLDTRWFVVVESNFQAEFHDVRNLGAPVRVLLRDKLDSFGMGAGCARIKTSDGSTQGVQLPGGAAASCDAKLKRYYGDEPGVIGLTDERTEIRRGKRSYKLRKRRQGTSILTVEVEENDKKVWSRELPYASPTFNTAIAVGGDSIAVWGAEPGDTQKGILVGLDETTGEQRYSVPSASMVSHSVGYFAFNGRYFLVQVWGSLEAYDPDTGKLAWKIGR